MKKGTIKILAVTGLLLGAASLLTACSSTGSNAAPQQTMVAKKTTTRTVNNSNAAVGIANASSGKPQASSPSWVPNSAWFK